MFWNIHYLNLYIFMPGNEKLIKIISFIFTSLLAIISIIIENPLVFLIGILVFSGILYIIYQLVYYGRKRN